MRTVHTIITGDVVKSTKIGDWQGLQNRLDDIFGKIRNRGVQQRQENPFEIFRGDSFQGLSANPVNALIFALIIRAGLRCFKKEIKKIKELPDARISIGVGGIDTMDKKLSQAKGEAFELSGKGLEKLEESGDRLIIRTPWKEINEEMEVACKLTDAVIEDWSFYSSEIVYYGLLYEETQTELASRLEIGQSAIAKRMKYAHLKAVRKFIERFQAIIEKKSPFHGTE